MLFLPQDRTRTFCERHTSRRREKHPFILTTVSVSDEVMQALNAGANGAIVKDSSRKELIAATRDGADYAPSNRLTNRDATADQSSDKRAQNDYCQLFHCVLLTLSGFLTALQETVLQLSVQSLPRPDAGGCKSTV